jgi:hypothetical protein
MQRLKDNELDALEAAQKAATPGEITLIPNGGIDFRDEPDQRYWALTAGVGLRWPYDRLQADWIH